MKTDEEQVHVIEEAIKTQQPVSFRYLNSEGKLTTHNAVYPKQITTEANHTLFQAYCYFTKDVRLFRLDRVQTLRLGKTQEPFSLRQEILGILVALTVLALVFILLLLFSPKYRWRTLRELLFTQLGIGQ